MGKITYFEYPIQYQDLDQNMRLRLYTLENMLLNAAGLAADEGGFGVQALLKQDCTWVLTNLALEVYYLPTVGETLVLETWVEQNVHMLSVRNYRLRVGESIVGQARSVWAVINIHNRTAQNVFSQSPFSDMGTGEKLVISKAVRMLPFSEEERNTPEGILGVWPHTVQYSDIDYNGHCNSCKYLEFMINACEPVALKQNLPSSPEACADGKGLRIDIKYAREIHRGEQVVVFWRPLPDADASESVAYELRTVSGELSCQARIASLTS